MIKNTPVLTAVRTKTFRGTKHSNHGGKSEQKREANENAEWIQANCLQRGKMWMKRCDWFLKSFWSVEKVALGEVALGGVV